MTKKGAKRQLRGQTSKTGTPVRVSHQFLVKDGEGEHGLEEESHSTGTADDDLEDGQSVDNNMAVEENLGNGLGLGATVATSGGSAKVAETGGAAVVGQPEMPVDAGKVLGGLSGAHVVLPVFGSVSMSSADASALQLMENQAANGGSVESLIVQRLLAENARLKAVAFDLQLANQTATTQGISGGSEKPLIAQPPVSQTQVAGGRAVTTQQIQWVDNVSVLYGRDQLAPVLLHKFTEKLIVHTNQAKATGTHVDISSYITGEALLMVRQKLGMMFPNVETLQKLVTKHGDSTDITTWNDVGDIVLVLRNLYPLPTRGGSSAGDVVTEQSLLASIRREAVAHPVELAASASFGFWLAALMSVRFQADKAGRWDVAFVVRAAAALLEALRAFRIRMKNVPVEGSFFPTMIDEFNTQYPAPASGNPDSAALYLTNAGGVATTENGAAPMIAGANTPRDFDAVLEFFGRCWYKYRAKVDELSLAGLRYLDTSARIPKRATNTTDTDPETEEVGQKRIKAEVILCGNCGKPNHGRDDCIYATFHPQGNKDPTIPWSKSPLGQELWKQFGITSLPSRHYCDGRLLPASTVFPPGFSAGTGPLQSKRAAAGGGAQQGGRGNHGGRAPSSQGGRGSGGKGGGKPWGNGNKDSHYQPPAK